MKVKGIVTEDFANYKEPSLFIVSAVCDWKCCVERGLSIKVCQNSPLVAQPVQDVPAQSILDAYRDNDITQAVVIGGLEPLLQMDELCELLEVFRGNGETCPFVIYTGYYPPEISEELRRLEEYRPIIIKFGRYIPHRPEQFDPILGITLASDNQFAIEL